MNCENFYCIYQEQGKCLLKEISLDISGQCQECIMVTFEDDDLKKQKYKQRQEL